MAYVVPPLADLSARARRFVSESISGAVVSLWGNIFAVIAKVLALVGLDWHLRIAWLSRQIFISTCDEEWLRRYAWEYALLDASSRATGFVVATATGAGIVPANLILTASDGSLFRTNAPMIIISAGLVNLPIEASALGAAGNLAPNTALTITDGLCPAFLSINVATDVNGLGGGSDPESVDSLRARTLERRRSPPQGGSKTDWIRWTQASSSSVLDVFVDVFLNDTRTVWVAFRMAGRPYNIPTPADVAAVQSYIGNPIRRPITSQVIAVQLTPMPVNVSIANLSPNTTNVQAAIQVELAAMFAERPLPSTPNNPFTLPRAWIDEAISLATGENSHTLVSPATDLPYTIGGQLPVLGTVSFI